MHRQLQDHWQLTLAYLTESQAIAIYQAECAVLRLSQFSPERGQSLALCGEIMQEEREHEKHLLHWYTPGWPVRLYSYPNAFLGFLVGLALALLPGRLCWRLHVIAEIQAAQTYARTANLLKHAEPELLRFLHEASSQEKLHADRFEKLLSG